MQTIEAEPGMDLGTAVRAAWRAANNDGVVMHLLFNGCVLRIPPGDDYLTVTKQYEDYCKARSLVLLHDMRVKWARGSVTGTLFTAEQTARIEDALGVNGMDLLADALNGTEGEEETADALDND